MAWQNYAWLANIRGVTMPEFRVLSFLGNEADLAGRIEALQSKSIATDCEIAENSVFRILKSLQTKKFLKRHPRFKHNGTGPQISNGYMLDLERYFPAGHTEGGKLWAKVLRDLDDPNVKIHAERTEAFWSGKTRNLSIYFEDVREARYFDRMKLKGMLALGRTYTPRIRYYDFLIKQPPRIRN
jgi:hypothetical protein